MLPFPNFESICCSVSSFNGGFFNCTQICKETDKVVWYSHHPKNFPQFVVIYTVKGFNVVNKAEVDDFSGILSLSLFFPMIQQMLEIFPFLNPACTSGSSWYMYCWSISWRILSITLLACKVRTIVQYFEHSLTLTFFGIVMKTDLCQSCGHSWVFQIYWHIECSTFTASSFWPWNSTAGIPSHPLALFTVMLPKVHLTLHMKISGSRWVITPSWLSGF